MGQTETRQPETRWSEVNHQTLRAVFGNMGATKIEHRLNRSKNGGETYHGHVIRGRDIAELVAATLEHMTGDRCTVAERGRNTYVVIRETSTDEVIA